MSRTCKGLRYAFLLCLISCSSEMTPVKVETREPERNFRVIAFYSGKASDVENYEAEKLTHIIFCFAHLNENIISIDSTGEETLTRLVALKKKVPKLKVLVSLGGWGGCETCSGIFSTAENREAFSISVRNLLLKFDADGIDMDWESPVIGGFGDHPKSPEDKANFTELLRELRKQLPPKSEISFDANSFREYLELSIDWKEVVPLVDFINLMTYTLPGNFRRSTGHHTALYSSADQTESADYAAKYLDSIGVPPEKIIMGAAFYGMVSENVDTPNHGLYQHGKHKSEYVFKKIEEEYISNPDYQYRWDSICQAPYLYSPAKKIFITFDDSQSVRLKTRYACQRGWGGIMFWRLNGDAFRNGLLDAIFQEKMENEEKKN